MNLKAFDGLRETFETCIGVAGKAQSITAREESGAYATLAMETGFLCFVAGYVLAFETMLKESIRMSTPPSEPTFTVTPDAQSRARDFESVNPDYPSPATYLEAE